MTLRQSHPTLGDLETFVNKNERLVMKSASMYSILTGVEFEDLVAEGMIGLMIAFDRFDESRGFEFSTYGVRCINGYILRYVRSHGRMIRPPAQVFELSISIYKKRLVEEEPEVIAEKLNVSVTKARQALAHAKQKRLTSLECPVDDNDTTIGDLVPEKNFDVTEQYVNDFLDKLTEFERKVTELLYWGFSRKEVSIRVGSSYSALSKRIEIIRHKAKIHFSL